MELSTPFLTKQVIAYIGNKRRLLELIYKAINSCEIKIKPGLRFFDVFAGSGIVSRLAKKMNFEVYANDWEYYTFVLNNGFVKTDHRDIEKIFGRRKELDNILQTLNNLPDPEDEDQYIAKYYAPKSIFTEEADFRKERLFFTRENALIIDKIRNEIDRRFSEPEQLKAKYLLLSLLLYEAATHTNTSGVFKAYHKGFGGHNGDAMQRITAPITMKQPVLIDSEYPVRIYKDDSNTLVKSGEITNLDIAYLDPPYNQHQYGSNYHMLNTIALWDKIPAPLTLNDKGVLLEKAAIRKDWVKTKSSYCYRESAVAAFSDLLQNMDAKHILISYSTDGIIPYHIMKEICAKKGRISIITNEYIKYRGGKQSNQRLNTNIEFVLTIDTLKKTTPGFNQRAELVIKKNQLLIMFKHKYSYKKLKEHSFSMAGNDITFNIGDRKIVIPSANYFELCPVKEIEDLLIEELDMLKGLLQKCVCSTKEEEIAEIISNINGTTKNNHYFIKLIPDTLRKLAHKKNRSSFYYCLQTVEALEREQPDLYSIIKHKISATKELAEKRFNN